MFRVQKIWREQLLKLKLFREIHQLVEKQPGKETNSDLILEKIVMALPTENWDTTFETVIRWARFGNLLRYDATSQKIAV